MRWPERQGRPASADRAAPITEGEPTLARPAETIAALRRYLRERASDPDFGRGKKSVTMTDLGIGHRQPAAANDIGRSATPPAVTGCLCGCMHGVDCRFAEPIPDRDGHCCLSMSREQREACARRGYYCGPGKCARDQLARMP